MSSRIFEDCVLCMSTILAIWNGYAYGTGINPFFDEKQGFFRNHFYVTSHQVKHNEYFKVFYYTLYRLVRMHRMLPEGKTADISSISTDGISCLWEQRAEFEIKYCKASQ